MASIKIRFEYGDISRYRNLKKINIEDLEKMMLSADEAFKKEMKENREKHNLDNNLADMEIYNSETVSPDGSYFCLNSILIMRTDGIVEVLGCGYGRMFIGHSVGTVISSS